MGDISKRPSRQGKSKWETFPRDLLDTSLNWRTFPRDPLDTSLNWRTFPRDPLDTSLNGGHFLLFPLSVSLSLALCLHLRFISISPPPSISIFLPSFLSPVLLFFSFFCFLPSSFPVFIFFLRKEILIILNESNRNASDD